MTLLFRRFLHVLAVSYPSHVYSVYSSQKDQHPTSTTSVQQRATSSSMVYTGSCPLKSIYRSLWFIIYSKNMTLGYFWMIRHLFRSDVCQGACRSRSQIRPLLSLLEAVTSNVSSGEKSTDLNKSRVNILFIDMDWPKKTHCRPLEDSLSHFTQSLISIETITRFEAILNQMIFIQMQPSSTKEPVCPWRVAWRHRCLSLIKLWHHLRLQNYIPKHQTNCLKKKSLAFLL